MFLFLFFMEFLPGLLLASSRDVWDLSDCRKKKQLSKWCVFYHLNRINVLFDLYGIYVNA